MSCIDYSYLANYISCDDTIKVRVPKTIASITLCGAVHFNIDDTMDFKAPTPEQIKNLKETFCIDVELFD